MDDPFTGMTRVLEATLDATAQGPGDMTARVRSALGDTRPDEFTEIVMMLKNSRCLDVTAERDEAGKPVIVSINGITTRGLRELQRASQAPQQVEACPTDPEDGRMGFGV